MDVSLFTARRPRALTVTAGGRRRGSQTSPLMTAPPFLVQISARAVGARGKGRGRGAPPALPGKVGYLKVYNHSNKLPIWHQV